MVRIGTYFSLKKALISLKLGHLSGLQSAGQALAKGPRVSEGSLPSALPLTTLPCRPYVLWWGAGGSATFCMAAKLSSQLQKLLTILIYANYNALAYGSKNSIGHSTAFWAHIRRQPATTIEN